MKKLSLILVSLILIFKVANASTYSSDPKMFIKELVNDAISKLSDKNLNEEEKRDFILNTKSTLDKSIYGHSDAKTHILQVIGKWIKNDNGEYSIPNLGINV